MSERKQAVTLKTLADQDWKTQLARGYRNIPIDTLVDVVNEDFVNFYQIIGVGIDDDKLFEFMVNNCWTSDNGEIKDENGNYGNKYNNGGAYANNNFSGRSQGNLMARAGSQIINNKF